MQIKRNITLSNGVQMPRLHQGVPLINSYAAHATEIFSEIIKTSLDNGIRAFDTSHDYGKSELLLGRTLKKLFQVSKYNREDVFITTKIGNEQQLGGDISGAVNAALKTLKIEQIDLVLLHWPVPNVYVSNWRKLIELYKEGKIRSIGIANVHERHLDLLKKENVEMMPHVVQFEYHPFRTVPSLVGYCKKENISIQAYTSLLQMIPLIRENELLNNLAKKYSKSIPQIVLRWNLQKDINPIFRSYNIRHLVETANVFSFELSKEDMNQIDLLNINFKFHPESMNCPGF